MRSNIKLIAFILLSCLASGADARHVVIRKIGGVTPPPVCGGSGTVYLTTVGAANWTPPSGFCPTDNQVEVISSGGSGSTGQVGVSYSTAGGSGAYAIKLNVSFTVGTPAAYSLGAAGVASSTRNTAGQAGGNSWICLTIANCTSLTDTGVIVGVPGGAGGNIGLTATGGLGGQASAAIGDTAFSGGNGAPTAEFNPNGGYGGGGGAACSLGVGGDGGRTDVGGERGGGGGGGGCGYFGQTPRPFLPNLSAATLNAGAGGFGRLGGSYGPAGNSGTTSPTSGATGTNGAGGGGGGGGSNTLCGNGGNGAAGIDMDATHGAGGGGGAAGVAASGTTPCNGGNGGLYGGGGGSGNFYGNPGSGGPPIIKITWPKPVAPPPSTYVGISDTRYTCLQTQYVSTTGNNANNGLTPATARAQIAWTVNNVATPGTCVLVLPGTYISDGSTNTSKIIHGGNRDSLTGYIAIVCDTPLQCFLVPPSGGGPILGSNTLDLTTSQNPVDFFIIDGFDIAGSLSPTFTGASSANLNCIEVTWGHHVKIMNNNIHECGGAGIQTGFMDYLFPYNNSIHNSAIWGSSAYSGISMVVPYYADKAVGIHYELARNYIWMNGEAFRNLGNHTDGDGIIFDSWVDERPYLGLTIVENNIVTHNGRRGIELLCDIPGFFQPANFIVRNNTVYTNDTEPLRGYTNGELFSQGCQTTTGYNGGTFVNNLAVADPNFAQSTVTQLCLLATWDNTSSIINNNIIWNGASPSTSCIQTFVSVTDGVNGNIVGHPPLITAPTMNTAKADWHLQTTSPGIGAGTLAYGAATIDFYGNPRVVGGQIDIGAVQGGHTATWMQAGSTLDLDFADSLSPTDVFTNYLTTTRSDTSEGRNVVTDVLPSSPPYYQGTGYAPNSTRLNYSATTGPGQGLLIEPATTNYIIDSTHQTQVKLVNNGNALAAGTYTLWVLGYNFYGGFATVSGCASGTATVAGVPFTFTLASPAVCTVTVSWSSSTASSDLTVIQLQNGATPSSYVVTSGTTFTGNSSGTTNLTASSVSPNGVIAVGSFVTGTGIPANTTILSQTSGTTGGAGVYVTSAATTVANSLVTAPGIPQSRGADFIVLKGTALSTAIASAASLFVDANGSAKSSPIYILQGDGYTLLQSSTSTTISGLTPTLTATFGSGNITSETKAATAFDGTGRSIGVNGGTVATDANVPGANTAVTVGDTQAGAGNEYNGSMGDLAIWASRISNSAISSLIVPATTGCLFGTALADGCPGAQAQGTIVDAHAMDPKAVLDLNIVGGSGYTNGTGYAWTSTGGGCSVAASGTIDVVGGLLGGAARGSPTHFTIANRGSGCTSRPTISIPAGAGSGTGGSITPTVYQLTPHNAVGTAIGANWNVAGVDYPIGYDTTLTLADPTAGGLPACASYVSGEVTINSSSCTINGWDFDLHSTHLLVAAGLTGIVITNNKFGCVASKLDEIHINPGTTGTIIKYNTFNGKSTGAGGCASGGQDGAIATKSTGGTLTVQYNYCFDQDSKCFDVSPSAASPFTDTIVEQYNYWADFGGCNCGSHAEAEYTFSSLTLGANPVHTWTMQFNTMIVHYWYGPTNATSAASIEADGSTIDTPNVQYNVEIARGTQLYTGSNNSVGQSGSAPMFCGAQESGGYTGIKTQKNNVLDYSGGFYPYNAGGSPGCAAVFTSLADFNLGTANSCNTSTCN